MAVPTLDRANYVGALDVPQIIRQITSKKRRWRDGITPKVTLNAVRIESFASPVA